MKPRCCLAVLAVGLVLGITQGRGEPPLLGKRGACFWGFSDIRHGLKSWCPDDYCPKKLPCVPCNPTGCVDDYCPKTRRCVPCNSTGCMDDYCPKNCPINIGNLCEPWSTCGKR